MEQSVMLFLKNTVHKRNFTQQEDSSKARQSRIGRPRWVGHTSLNSKIYGEINHFQ